MKETNLKTYGNEYAQQSEVVKAKMKEINLERYGVDNPLKSPEVKDKIKQTNLNRYGTEYPMQSKEIQEKSKQTNIDRYGVEYSSQCLEVKIKTHDTRLDKQYEILVEKLAELELNFTADEYQGTKHNRYSFTCKKCGFTFDDRVSDGHIPQCRVCHPIVRATYVVGAGEKEMVEYVKECIVSSGKKYNIVENMYFHSKGEFKKEYYSNSHQRLELDCYIPELKVGFEYDGTYWHTETADGNTDQKEIGYHQYKNAFFSEMHDIKIYHIKEEVWENKKELVKKIISKLIFS